MVSATAEQMKRGFVLSPHGNIEYFELGAGEPLVMLHPTPFSCMSFRDVAPLLAGEARVISMSTMGFGQSDRPPAPYTTLHEFAQATIWLLDELGLEKANVYGLLTGSQTAVEVAAGWPERVEKLVLEECFNWNTPSRRAVHERVHRYIPEQPDGSHLIELWKKMGGDREGADLRRSTEWFINNLLVNSNEGAAVYGETGWEGAATYAMCRYELWDSTPKIQAPTLVMHTANSERGRAHDKFLATISRSRGVRLPNREEPELWAREVLAFLREPSV
jgi:pimeloyl-ACP methyl ester carboxylesterase